MECPFLCGFHTTNDHHADYQITVHIELHHTPDSHFAIEDEDLNLALALQRDEERQVFAEAKDHGSPTESSAKDLGTRKEGAAYPLDADFPYAECPQCEDFVHFVEFDEHMNNHLSLQYSSDSITNMAEFDSEHDANLRQSPIDPQGLTTIARPIDQRDKKSSQNNNATVFAAARPKGTRLGVSHVHSFLLPCQDSYKSCCAPSNTEHRDRRKNLVHTHSRTECLRACSSDYELARQQDD